MLNGDVQCDIFSVLFYYYFYSLPSLYPCLCFDIKSVMLMNRTTNVTLMQFSFIIADALLHSRHAIEWIIRLCLCVDLSFSE